MDPPKRIDPTIHRSLGERSYHGATSRSDRLTHTYIPRDTSQFTKVLKKTRLSNYNKRKLIITFKNIAGFYPCKGSEM